MESEVETNPAEPEVETEATETPEVETETPETEAEEAQPDPEEDEIELEGQKYKIPKAVKPLVMMQADYTRKTQEVAEQRRALEAEKAQQAELVKTLRVEIGTVYALEAQKAQFDAVSVDQWAELYAQDPEQYRQLQAQQQRLSLELDRARQDLTQKEQAALHEANANRVKAVQEATEVLQKEIPGWSPEYAGKLADFATSAIGVTRDELRDTLDPRMWKLLHLAHGQATKAQTEQKAQQQAKLADVKPAATTKGAAKSSDLSDDLPMSEWLRRREAQLRKGAR